MKKTAVISLVILLFCAVSVSALEYGVNFNAGMKHNFLNPFIYQDVTFRLEFNDKCGLDVGVDMMENFKCAPYFYLSPMLSLYAGHVYLGGGILYVPDYYDQISFFGELGFTFGRWQIGPGIGNIDIGFNISPTFYKSDKEPQSDNLIGQIIESIVLNGGGFLFNMPKLKIGFEWYLPL